MKNTTLTYIIVLLLLLLIATKVTHAETSDLSVSPSVIRLVAKPGSQPELKFTLENKGDPQIIKLRIYEFRPVNASGHIKLSNIYTGPVEFKIEDATLLFKSPFLLKSNYQQVVNIKMSIPEQILEKDYYFTLLAETSPFPAPDGETTVKFSTQLGANILLSISKDGRTEKKASIPLFVVPRNIRLPFFKNISIYDSFDNVPVILMIKNSGQNVISPDATVALKGWNIKRTYTLDKKNILSSSQRVIFDRKNCSKDCPDSSSILMKGLFIGNYKLTATVSIEGKSSYIYTTTSFLALPIKLIFILVLISLLSFYLSKKLKEY